jgi:hypothetical protein
MRRNLITATVLCSGLAVLAGGVLAQNRGVVAPPATITEQELLDMKDLAEQGSRLKAETEAALRELAEKERTLESIATDARTAREFVGDVMKLLRDAAGRLGPDSSYMKILQAQEVLLRSAAAEALASQNNADHPYGAKLNEQAATIASLRAEAGELAGRLSAEIDRLGRIMPQMGYARIVWQTGRFIGTARAYLETVEQVLRRTSETAAKAEDIARQTIPTQ